MSQTPMSAGFVQSMLGELLDGDDHKVRGYLRSLGIEPGSIRLLPKWNSTVGVSTVPPSGDNQAGLTAEEVLSDALRRAVPHPLGAAIIGLFTHFVCEQEWEYSYHYRPILHTLHTMRSVWRVCRHLAPGAADAAAMDAVGSLLTLLTRELTAESQMCVGSLEAFESAAETAWGAATHVIEEAARIEATSPVLARYLAANGRTRQCYYRLVAAAARAGVGFIAGRIDDAGLAKVIDQLRDEDPQRLLAENDKSEVRAHRHSLEAMLVRSGDPWLRVEHGKIVYLYPFGLRASDPAGLDQTEFAVVDRVRAEGAGWELAGAAVDHVESELSLDNMWSGRSLVIPTAATGAGRGSSLAGAAIELPPVSILTTDGVPLTELTAGIVLSDLGNHHVRFEARLRDATPHQVQFELYRAAPEHGAVQVRLGGGSRQWERLSELAADLIRSLHARLNAGGARWVVSAHDGLYHVVLSVHAASTTVGPVGTVRTPVGTAQQALEAVGGGTLLEPVPSAVTSFAEWSRRRQSMATIVPGVGFTTDLVARTPNTTAIIMPGTPDWGVETFRSMAEFVASLDGLATSWFDELNTQLKEIQSITRQIDRDTRSLSDFIDRLRTKQVRLQNFVAEARSLQLLLRSPVLVESPLNAEILRRLLTAANFERVEEDFSDKARELLDDRLGARLNDMAARQEQRRRAALEAVLTLVTVAGLSGLVQVFEGGPGVGWSNLQSLAVAAGVFVGAALLVAGSYLVGSRFRGR